MSSLVGAEQFHRMISKTVLLCLAASSMHCSSYPKIVVPAFFAANANDPNTNKTYWSEIPLDPTNKKQPLKAVVAECSFPELSTQNPAAIATVKQLFQSVHNDGGLVLGYVDTRFGTLARGTGADTHCDGPSDPDQRIRDWYSVYANFQDANGNATPGLDGIFFDDGPTYDPSTVQSTPGIPTSEVGFQTYYNGLFSDFKTGKIVNVPNNSHLTIFLNASQYPFSWVIDGTQYTIPQKQRKPGIVCPNLQADPACSAAADMVVTFEQSWAHYQTSFAAEYPPNQTGTQPPAWWVDGVQSRKTAHVIFNVDAASFNGAVSLAKSRNAGFVYFMDCLSGDTNCPQIGGYGHLPTYWSTEYNALSLLDAATSPSFARTP